MATKLNPTIAWTPFGVALKIFSKEGADKEQAWDRMLARLKSGTLRAKATAVIEKENGEHVATSHDREMEPASWASFQWHTPTDWALGDLRGTGYDEEIDRDLTWEIQGLMVETTDLEQFGRTTARSPGRPLGDFWPDLSREIALYTYELGPRILDKSVSGACNEILDRMAQSGAKGPESIQSFRRIVAEIMNHIRESEDS